MRKQPKAKTVGEEMREAGERIEAQNPMTEIPKATLAAVREALECAEDWEKYKSDATGAEMRAIISRCQNKKGWNGSIQAMVKMLRIKALEMLRQDEAK